MTVEELTARSPAELLEIKGVGPGRIEEITEALEARGFSLAANGLQTNGA